jgi:hypothetical protein
MTKSEIGAELLRTHQLLWLACDQLAPERQTISYNGKWSALQNLRHITKSVGGVARFLKTDKAILDTKFGQSGRASISPEELHAA